MTRGLPLFVLTCALVAALYAASDPALKWAALAALGFLYVLTAIPSKAAKHDGEDKSTTIGKVS